MLKSFFNWRVLLNIVAAAGVFTGLVWLTFRWLEFHTNHGQEFPVPNVINLSVQDAIKTLDDAGLDYEVDSLTYDPKYKPLQVLKMWPYPGSKVKKNRTIRVLVNPKTWAKVTVPDVLDRYKGLAFRQLEQVGLKVGDTLYEPSIQRDAVIRMLHNGNTLKPGTLLPRFTTIDIVIGAGPKRNITIPNLVGLTVKEAKAVIQQNLFEVGIVEHEDGGSDESDIVYYQDPAAYDIRDQGMQIDIWASKRTPAEMSTKIAQLNSIYRIKIDTTVPPPNWDDTPVYHTPETRVPPLQEEPKPAPAKPVEEKPKNNTPATTATQKPVTTNQPKSTSAPAEEKPKARKVVVE
ncbi:MAG: PASTA domain-containing protein [Bergeyella sp.]